MVLSLQVVTVFLASVAMSLALAHVLELPRKMRINKETYIAVQSIYYPGFTIGEIGEGVGMLAAFGLQLMTPAKTTAFWCTLTGLTALIAMQGVYWLVTHPVNKFWLKDEQLKGLGAGFFSLDPMKRGAVAGKSSQDWARFRDQWEHSQVARAGLSVIALIALIIAIAI